MNATENKIASLLRMASVEAGTTPAEASTAATIAVALAKKIGNGQLVARCLRVQFQARQRAERAS